MWKINKACGVSYNFSAIYIMGGKLIAVNILWELETEYKK